MILQSNQLDSVPAVANNDILSTKMSRAHKNTYVVVYAQTIPVSIWSAKMVSPLGLDTGTT